MAQLTIQGTGIDEYVKVRNELQQRGFQIEKYGFVCGNIFEFDIAKTSKSKIKSVLREIPDLCFLNKNLSPRDKNVREYFNKNNQAGASVLPQKQEVRESITSFPAPA